MTGQVQETVDIRPQSDIYETYRRLSYKPWYAMAEFVDNSTANYFVHREELTEAGPPNLEVSIWYDRDAGTLTIVDDAHGMEVDEFRRALQLAKPPANTSGRSEFGMGLKTAACWMGPRWTITSKQLGSTRELSSTVDVGQLKSERPDSLTITIADGIDPGLHYTRISVNGMSDYDRIFVGRTLGKIKRELASIYRRDIQSGEIRITFNGEILDWESPALITETVGSELITWKKDVDITVHGKPVTGWIGILAKGAAVNGGFNLVRRGRLITGGPGQAWKPWEIFKAPNSFQSQRLTGELNFDEWRISHTKDQIEWSGPEEQDLINQLTELSKDYIAKAKESRKDGTPTTLSKASAENILGQAAEEAEESEALGANLAVIEMGVLPSADPAETDLVASLVDELGDFLDIKFGGKAYPALHLALADEADESEPIVRLGFPKETDIAMVLNLAHPFVRQFVGRSEQAMKLLAHMLYADALVERISRRDPSLAPAQLRLVKDQLLRKLEPLAGTDV